MENSAENIDKVAAARAAMKAKLGKKGPKPVKMSAAQQAALAELGNKKKQKGKAGFEGKPGLSKQDAGFSH
jgi:hypothetical protein